MLYLSVLWIFVLIGIITLIRFFLLIFEGWSLLKTLSPLQFFFNMETVEPNLAP